MAKIVVMDWKGFKGKVKSDIEEGLRRGKFRDDGGVIYAETLEAGLSALTAQRLRLLTVVKEKRPSSIYQLAKELGKDIKTVHSDATLLSGLGLLTLQPHKENGKVSLRPVFRHRKITLELAV